MTADEPTVLPKKCCAYRESLFLSSIQYIRQNGTYKTKTSVPCPCSCSTAKQTHPEAFFLKTKETIKIPYGRASLLELRHSKRLKDKGNKHMCTAL